MRKAEPRRTATGEQPIAEAPAADPEKGLVTAGLLFRVLLVYTTALLAVATTMGGAAYAQMKHELGSTKTRASRALYLAAKGSLYSEQTLHLQRAVYRKVMDRDPPALPSDEAIRALAEAKAETEGGGE